jgi:hypothetical protein
VKLTKSQLKELIRYTIVDLTEKTFGSRAQYDAYRKKHNLKPGSKHKVAGKTVTVRDTKKISKKAKSLGDKMADKLNKRMADLEKKRKQGKGVFDVGGPAHPNVKKKRKVKESTRRKYTIKEVRMWMKKLEENRYKKVYNSDARRVAWMVNNEGVSLDEMPESMKKKWTKAQYGRERYLAKEFIKSKSEQMNEGKLNETKFIAFYKSKKVTINAKSLYDAKKQIIDKLKVPKKDYGIVSVLNKTEYDKQQFRFEQKLRKSIREIIKEQLNEYTGAGKPIPRNKAKQLFVPEREMIRFSRVFKKLIQKGFVYIGDQTKEKKKLRKHYTVTVDKKMYDNLLDILMSKRFKVKT